MVRQSLLWNSNIYGFSGIVQLGLDVWSLMFWGTFGLVELLISQCSISVNIGFITVISYSVIILHCTWWGCHWVELVGLFILVNSIFIVIRLMLNMLDFLKLYVNLAQNIICDFLVDVVKQFSVLLVIGWSALVLYIIISYGIRVCVRIVLARMS